MERYCIPGKAAYNTGAPDPLGVPDPLGAPGPLEAPNPLDAQLAQILLSPSHTPAEEHRESRPHTGRRGTDFHCSAGHLSRVLVMKRHSIPEKITYNSGAPDPLDTPNPLGVQFG